MHCSGIFGDMSRRRVYKPMDSRTVLLDEEPSVFFSEASEAFISRERGKQGKRWVHDVVLRGKEAAFELVRTADFVLLPDHGNTAPLDRSSKAVVEGAVARKGVGRGGFRTGDPRPPRVCDPVVHLLCIVTAPSLRCLRDLRSEHVALLEGLQASCLETMRTMWGMRDEDVLIYVNYPPSVYQLHFHVCAPFQSAAAYDAFRVHPLATILGNLRLGVDYYERIPLRVPVLVGSDLHTILTGGTCALDTVGASGHDSSDPEGAESPVESI